MVVDYILDRKQGVPYDAKDFYDYVQDEYSIWHSDIFENILLALDYGTNEDVQKALCNYIIKQDYNLKICDYINSMDWLQDYE